MKKWYYKLKESENYNVIILAILLAIAVKIIHYIYVTGINVYQVAQWEMRNGSGALMIGSTLLAVVFLLLAAGFVWQACRKEPKFMICAIVALAVVAVMGVSFCAIQCMIACGYWMWMKKTSSDKSGFYHIKRLTIILVAFSVALFVAWELSCWIPYGIDSFRMELEYALPRIFVRCFNPEIFLVAYLYKCSERKAFKNMCRVAAVIWIVLVICSILYSLGGVFAGGYFTEWGPASVEEGDWSEWTTLDEDGNIVPLDEDGNSSTYQSFEFE